MQFQLASALAVAASLATLAVAIPFPFPQHEDETCSGYGMCSDLYTCTVEMGCTCTGTGHTCNETDVGMTPCICLMGLLIYDS